MSNNADIYQGTVTETIKAEAESLTFVSLMKRYNGGVLIPKIQRDYAQGRKKEEDNGRAENIRKGFLKDIFNGNAKNLDFIFGTKSENNNQFYFIPIDGQQRLTTLFLLHLYEYKRIGVKGCYDYLRKFSYDTRRAARDFCKKVVENDWIIIQREGNHSDNISYSIKNCNWFMDYWQYDPTVDSMLRMLDTIDVLYKYHNKMPDIDNITFFCLDMDAYNINENLYLKMNSRGKPLTPFENLKANIEDLLEKKNGNGELIVTPSVSSFCIESDEDKKSTNNNFLSKWKYHFDRGWTNWFWNNGRSSNNTIDKSFAEFICRFLGGFQRIHGDENIENKDIEDKLCLEIDDQKVISFEYIENALLLNEAFDSISFILQMFCEKQYSKLLPIWHSKKDGIAIETYPWLAVIQTFLISSQRNDQNQWMRFAWNMAENYIVGKETYISYCSLLRQLLSNTNECLYSKLANLELENANEQLKEEIIKAKQIILVDKDPCAVGPSELEIIAAEKHAFFKGSIRFLYQDAKCRVNWFHFDKKCRNARKYYCDNGVVDKYRIVLIESFVKRLTTWSQLYDKQIFNTYPKTWKNSILCNVEYSAPVHDILMANNLNEINYFDNFCEKKQAENNIKQELCNKGLIKHVINNNLTSHRLRWNTSYIALNSPKGKKETISLDWWWIGDGVERGNRRNHILQNDMFKITNHPISGTSYYYGIDINFELCIDDTIWKFQWYKNNYIYLMTDSGRDYRINNKDSKIETDKYFCFNANNMDELDVLYNIKLIVSNYKDKINIE